MIKIKIFNYNYFLEPEINSWLEENKDIEIITTNLTVMGQRNIYTILYKEKEIEKENRG